MKRRVLGFCLVGLFVAASTAGCSSTGGPVHGSGESNGSGGSSSSGGSNGSGGTSSSGGSNGSGGSSGSGGATSSCATPSAALITDFSAAGQLGTPYTGADMGLTPPTAAPTDGALVINVDTGTATTMYPYAFVGMGFMACVNASTYQGVSFNISGTLTDTCTLQFSTVDKQHNTPANGGTCMATSCYPSAKIFTLPSSATDVTINFADQTGGGADTGAAVVDPTQIMAIQFQITPPATGSCTGKITVDNVTFK